MTETQKKFSAVSIKKLWYTDVLTDAPTSGEALTASATEIENVHQDTWQIEESEPSQDSYRNQLTGSIYRMGEKTMGEVTFNFTIGRYDFKTKAALMGGTFTETSWARPRGIVEIKKCLIALTQDDVYCVLPAANLTAREANTDGAVGIGVVGTMLEPDNTAIMPEYWFAANEA